MSVPRTRERSVFAIAQRSGAAPVLIVYQTYATARRGGVQHDAAKSLVGITRRNVRGCAFPTAISDQGEELIFVQFEQALQAPPFRATFQGSSTIASRSKKIGSAPHTVNTALP
jgi:hypothetical protein